MGAMIKNLKNQYPVYGEYIMIGVLSFIWPSFGKKLEDMLRRALKVLSGPNPAAGRYLYAFVFSMLNMTTRVLVLQLSGFGQMIFTNIATAATSLLDRHTFHYNDMIARIYNQECTWYEALKEN